MGLKMDTSTDMAVVVTEDKVQQYKAYDCDYKACKYKEKPITWGELADTDYEHFLYLLSEHVGVDTMTFKVLSTLLSDEDQQMAATATRYRDTPAGKKEEEDRYLKLTCGFNGKSKGQTWQFIKDNNYSFFVWAVGNAMNREGKTFNVLKRCLKAEDRELVESTAKGEVRPRKKQRNSK